MHVKNNVVSSDLAVGLVSTTMLLYAALFITIQWLQGSTAQASLLTLSIILIC